MTAKPRILFVGDAYSVHSARWVNMLVEDGWDVHFFDPGNGLVHEGLGGVTLHTGWKKPSAPPTTRVVPRWPFGRGRFFMARWLPGVWERVLSPAQDRLAGLIRKISPDCVHSLGLWMYSETVLAARELLGGLDCPWLYSNRGSDIFFYQETGRRAQIEAVLGACTHYLCDCQRDEELALQFGFRGELLGVIHGAGGFHTQEMRSSWRRGSPSERRTVAVKGLQTQYGNAGASIEALSLCSKELQGYRVVFFQAQPEIARAALSWGRREAVLTEVMERSPQQNVWGLLGESRICVGVSYSDSVPTTMLESMIMGAFPIQTDPGGASGELIQSGFNGLLIPPDDPEKIAESIRIALADAELVDRAEPHNLKLMQGQIEFAVVKDRVRKAYGRVLRNAASSE